MSDMIDRDAATAAFAAWLEDQRQCIPAHGWEFAAALQNDNPLAALPAVTVGVKPLRYFIAQGETVDQVREHARAHPLAKEGDMKLVWVNEGDLYDHSIFLAALEPVTQPAPTAGERLIAAAKDALEGRVSVAYDPQPAPDARLRAAVAQLDAGDVREAAQTIIDRVLQEASLEAAHLRELMVNATMSIRHPSLTRYRRWAMVNEAIRALAAALLTEKPHDRAALKGANHE